MDRRAVVRPSAALGTFRDLKWKPLVIMSGIIFCVILDIATAAAMATAVIVVAVV
jgi:hypothetical protein